MIIQLHIDEDAKRFPRLRVDYPIREHNERPSVRMQNYALERFNDLVAICRLHGELTKAAEQGKVIKCDASFRGLFRLCFSTDDELKKLLKGGD